MKRKLKHKQKLKYESDGNTHAHAEIGWSLWFAPFSLTNTLYFINCHIQLKFFCITFQKFSLWNRKMQIIFIWLSLASVFLPHLLQASFKKNMQKPWTRSLIKTFRHSFETFHWKQTKSPSNVRKYSTQIVFETHSMWE